MADLLEQINKEFVEDYNNLTRNGKLNVELEELNDFVEKHRFLIKARSLVDYDFPEFSNDPPTSAMSSPVSLLFILEYIIGKC